MMISWSDGPGWPLVGGPHSGVETRPAAANAPPLWCTRHGLCGHKPHLPHPIDTPGCTQAGACASHAHQCAVLLFSKPIVSDP